MKKILIAVLTFSIALSSVACTRDGAPDPRYYDASGIIKLDGVGLKGVTLVQDGEAVATTDANGQYELKHVEKKTELSPVLEGYEFYPREIEILSHRQDADFTALAVSGDTDKPEVDEPAKDPSMIAEPTDGSLYDDFDDGLDIKTWDIVSKKWGATEFKGVVPTNVNYTEDGVLVLDSKGSFYPDASQRNSGSAVVTKEALGPGKFEIAAKISPRIGMCTAFWTFYYEKESINHEIDIEFPGKNQGRIGLDTVLNTNWTGVYGNQYTTHHVHLPSLDTGSDLKVQAQNDGNWHKYGFEWSVENGYVKYYIDDILTQTITTNIPSIEGQLWLGLWQPVGWAGVPEYESSAILVDWVGYKPFNEQICTLGEFGHSGKCDGYHKANVNYLEKKVVGENLFPQEPIKYDYSNLEFISNGSFSGYKDAWVMGSSNSTSNIIPTDYTASNYVLRLINNSTMHQNITGVYEGFKYILKGEGMVVDFTDTGKLAIKAEFINSNGEVILTDEYVITSQDQFESFSLNLTAPKNSVTMKVSLVSLNNDSQGQRFVGYVDNLSMIRDFRVGE